MSESKLQYLEQAAVEPDPHLVEQIMSSIKADKPCVVLGPRSSGKTELLHAVQQVLARDALYVCRYVNLDQPDMTSESSFFRSLAGLISSPPLGGAQPAQYDMLEPVRNGAEFRAFLHHVVEDTRRNLVLLFDHLEQCPNDLLRLLLTSLRADYMNKYGQRQSDGRSIVAVVAGALSLATLTVGEASPFRGAANLVTTGDPADTASHSLLAQLTQAGFRLTNSAHTRLLHAAGGDLHLIKQLSLRCARAVIAAHKATVTVSMINRVIRTFMNGEVDSYPPLQEAIRLIEDDPDLVRCTIVLLEHKVVPLRELPLPISPGLDPLYLTGIVSKVIPNNYTIKNEIYRSFLTRHFSLERVKHLLTMSGRWNQAIDYLAVGVRADDDGSRRALVETAISAMYASETSGTAAIFFLRGLSMAFPFDQACLWLVSTDKQKLTFAGRIGNYQHDTNSSSVALTEADIPLTGDALEARVYQDAVAKREQQGGIVTYAVPLLATNLLPIAVLVTEVEARTDKSDMQWDRDASFQNYMNQAARALQEVSTRIERAETLREISTVISSSEDINTVLDTILIQMARVLPFSRAAITVLNETRAEWQVKAQIGFQGPAIKGSLLFQLTDDHPYAELLREKRPVRLPQASKKDPVILGGRYRVTRASSQLLVPLVLMDEVQGVITFDSFVEDAFTVDHVNLAQSIANQAAIAIQRAQRNEREQLEKELIRATAKMASAVESLDATWELILEGARKLTKAESGVISLVDKSRNVVVIQRGFPEPYTRHELPIGRQSILGWVAATGKPALVTDVRSDPFYKDIYNEALEDTVAEVAVPILHGDLNEVVGIINLESPRPGAFSKTDLDLLEDLALHADLAVHNAQQYGHLEENKRLLEMIHQASKAILKAGLQPDKVLQTILDQAVEVCGASVGNLWLVDGADLVLEAVWPQEHVDRLPERLWRKPITDSSLPTRAVLNNEAELVADILATDASDGRAGSELAVVLRNSGGEAIGVFDIYHPESGGLGKTQRKSLINLANVAVLALQNAKRYQSLQKSTTPIVLFNEQWEECQKSIHGSGDFCGATASLLESVARLLNVDLKQPLDGVSHGDLHAFLLDISAVVTGLKLSETLPVVFLKRDRMMRDDIADLRFLLSEKLHCSERAVLLVVFIERVDDPYSDICQEIAAHGYDLVFASKIEIQSIISSVTSQHELRKLLIANTDLVHASPYVVKGPTPPNMFFGREREIKMILAATAERSVAIMGGRRIGKTSIMRRVEFLAQRRTAGSPVHVKRVDCQTVDDYDGFFTAVKHAYGGWHTLDTSMEGFLGLIDQLNASGSAPILLLDEVDQILDVDKVNNYLLFRMFRSLSQSQRCQFVFGGEKILMNSSHDSSSPLFNFCEPLALGYLDSESSRLLLVEPMRKLDVEIGTPKDVVSIVLDVTSCHPCLLQYVGHHLLRQLTNDRRRLITSSDVRGILGSVDFVDEYFETIWGTATSLERLVTLLMCQGHVTTNDITKQLAELKIDATHVALNEALKHLCLYPIIEKVDKDNYRFQATWLPKFMQKERDLQLEIDGTVEQYRVE